MSQYLGCYTTARKMKWQCCGITQMEQPILNLVVSETKMCFEEIVHWYYSWRDTVGDEYLCGFHSGSDLVLHHLGFQMGPWNVRPLSIPWTTRTTSGRRNGKGSKWLWQGNLLSRTVTAKEQGRWTCSLSHFLPVPGKSLCYVSDMDC